MNDKPSVGNRAFAVFTGGHPFRFPRETLVVIVVFAVVWELLAWITPPFVIPGWSRIFQSLVNLPFDYVLITLARVAAALLISFLMGLMVAILMYSSKSFERYANPVVRLFMAVPVVCWILFSVLWFKWVEFRIAFVLIATCAPVFIVDCLDAMKGVPKDSRDMLRSFRPSQLHYFSKLILPATLPVMFTSWKVNLSLAIRVVTIAELVGAVSGIGYGLTLAQELFSIADVFAWTLVLVIILLLAEAAIERIEGRVLRWRV